jgi:hypothetical protein
MQALLGSLGALLGSLGTTYNCQPSSSLVPILLLGTKCVNPPIATTDMSQLLVTNALKIAWAEAGFVPGLSAFHWCMGQRIRPLSHGDHTHSAIAYGMQGDEYYNLYFYN